MTIAELPGASGSIARATGWLALGNISSRLLGLAREMLLAHLFGATPFADALRIAFFIPRTLYDLLIGGHLNGAIVPVLGAEDEREGRASLWQIVNLLLALVSLMLALVLLILEWLAPTLLQLVAPQVAAETPELAAQLLRITAPGLLCFGIFAILSGALLALRRFTWPAFAVTVFNGAIVVILSLIALAGGERATAQIRLAAAAWLFAAFLMMSTQGVGLWRAGWRFRRPRFHPQLRRILLLSAPILLTLLLDVLVARLFTYRLANQSGVGSINYLELGTTLIQFPQGLVAAAISLAILPTLARHAASETDADARQFAATLNRGLRLATALILPAAAGFFVLAPAIITLLFQHGAFTPADASRTAEVLRFYLPGLPFAALDLILIYAFYARQDTRTPALIGALCHLFYLVIALLLWPGMGLLALMLADSAKHALHASLSAWQLQRQSRALDARGWAKTAWRCLAATMTIAALAAAIFALARGALGENQPAIAASLILSSGAAALAYFAILKTLKISELADFFAHLRRGSAGE